MGLEKAIEHGKEHRKPYHGAARFDPLCRNHGACEWCKRNRLHKAKVQEMKYKIEKGEEYGEN